MKDLTVNRFRTARGRILREQIARLARYLGRDIVILDVGGRADYWDNVGLEHVRQVRIQNYDPDELARQSDFDRFTFELGDARNLTGYGDGSVDLVHANSVIEHVGQWPDMVAMAREVRRVGLCGWIQTPAWEFPVEPHFRLPFVHWVAPPLRRRLLWAAPDYRPLAVQERRYHVDRINLVSRQEFDALFPDCTVYVERVLFPKSFTARWAPTETILA